MWNLHFVLINCQLKLWPLCLSGKAAPPVKRELLRHRDYKVDLESKLGKTIVITKTTPQAEMGGCDESFDVLIRAPGQQQRSTPLTVGVLVFQLLLQRLRLRSKRLH